MIIEIVLGLITLITALAISGGGLYMWAKAGYKVGKLEAELDNTQQVLQQWKDAFNHNLAAHTTLTDEHNALRRKCGEDPKYPNYVVNDPISL